MPVARAAASGRTRRLTVAASFLAVAAPPAVARAFPPYRSTDADTAEPWTLEPRLGLLRLVRDEGRNEYSAPLGRVNLGLPDGWEAISEFEFRADRREMADAAAGFKWIPLRAAASVGVEVLGLLPVSSEGGAGVEASGLATARAGMFLLHVNAGGFHDGRPSSAESGWTTSALGELRIGRFRPGYEVWAKWPIAERPQAIAGPGCIVDVGPVDLRAGFHRGLVRAAPDLVASFWVSGTLPLR